MIYKCQIVKINDDQITILIDDTEIIGFSNQGVISDVGIETEVELEFYDELKFNKSDSEKPYIERKGNSLSYLIVGKLNVDEMKIQSIIDFYLEPEDLYDYGFLDGAMVQVDVLRINFEFK